MSEATQSLAEVSQNGQPRSAPIAARGVRTGSDFATLMSSLMSDVLEGRVAPGVCNAAVNAGGKLLKIVEMQQKYGKVGDSDTRELTLTTHGDPQPLAIKNRLAEIEAELAAFKTQM